MFDLYTVTSHALAQYLKDDLALAYISNSPILPIFLEGECDT